MTTTAYSYLTLLGGTSDTIYRIQTDGTAHYVGPRGDWEPLPYRWPTGLEGLRKTAEQAEAQRRKRSGNDTIDELGLHHGGNI